MRWEEETTSRDALRLLTTIIVRMGRCQEETIWVVSNDFWKPDNPGRLSSRGVTMTSMEPSGGRARAPLSESLHLRFASAAGIAE